MSKIEKRVLESNTGFIVEVLNLGGIITKIMALDKHGNRENVVLNYENLDDYLTNPLYLGCFVGPVAGRTKNGYLPMGDKHLQLDVSCHPNSLHACNDGLHNVIWHVDAQTNDSLVLSYETKSDRDIINFKLTYTVSEETLTVHYYASATSKTYLSLTNHSYFNLSGNPEGTIKSHKLKLNCSHFVRLDHESLPIELIELNKSELDFSSEKTLGDVIESTAPDIRSASGIDHPFKCSNHDCTAVLKDDSTGRMLQVATTQPYVIVYSGNFLHSALSTSKKQLKQFSGICFETQDLPNILNNKLDAFKFVQPGTPYNHRTSFTFSTF